MTDLIWQMNVTVRTERRNDVLESHKMSEVILNWIWEQICLGGALFLHFQDDFEESLVSQWVEFQLRYQCENRETAVFNWIPLLDEHATSLVQNMETLPVSSIFCMKL